jgi:fumarate reductase flavoprotein subunit
LDFPKRICDNLNCRDDAIGPGWGGTFVKYTMLKAIEEQKLDVRILVGTAARHLVLDDKGAISGVLCEDEGGEVRIRCKAAVLTTGGFGKSNEKLQEFAPDFFAGDREPHRFSVPTDTGDSIDMLRELGVEPNPARMFISMFGPKHHPYSNVLADLALEPEVLQINCLGKRWADESAGLHGLTASLLAQPKTYSWAITSRSEYAFLADRMIHNPAFASKASLYETWEADIEEEAALPVEPPVRIADTLEGIAEACGLPADALVETVKAYNASCAAGEDKEFGKPSQFLRPIPMEGPYYAIYGGRFSEASMGGVTVNGNCQVLRNDGTPIPGLYAGGDCTSAMHRKGKLAVISELTWAVASSFTSGNQVVAYIDSL